MTTLASVARPWRKWARNNSVGINFTQRAISSGRLKVRRVRKKDAHPGRGWPDISPDAARRTGGDARKPEAPPPRLP